MVYYKSMGWFQPESEVCICIHDGIARISKGQINENEAFQSLNQMTTDMTC